MTRKSFLVCAVVFLIVALVTGLLFNVMNLTKNSFIWAPALFVIIAGGCLFKRSRIPIVSNKVGPEPVVNNDTPKLTPSMNAPKAPPSNKDVEARLTIS